MTSRPRRRPRQFPYDER